VTGTIGVSIYETNTYHDHLHRSPPTVTPASRHNIIAPRLYDISTSCAILGHKPSKIGMAHSQKTKLLSYDSTRGTRRKTYGLYSMLCCLINLISRAAQSQHTEVVLQDSAYSSCSSSAHPCCLVVFSFILPQFTSRNLFPTSAMHGPSTTRS